MFRVRLAAVIAVSFCFVLGLGGLIYWGSSQVALDFQRSQSAYEAFDRYERVSHEAYRYFKQRMDSLVTNTEAAQAGVAPSRQRLGQAIEELRDAAVKEADAGEWQARPVSLERVARLTAFLEASEYRFDEVERLRQQGQRGRAAQTLSAFSEQEIDGTFQPLVDAAIGTERDNARAARERLETLMERSRWIAVAASAIAALFAITSGMLLLRGFRNPVEALMQGTDAIASGNLAHRIELPRQDEFGYLATHFNHMAGELERQQARLKEGKAALEQRVAERTVELHRLNGELLRMDTARREFLADISHELRTPITVIRGEAEVTLRTDEWDAEECRETLERIAEMSLQLGTYVDDLLFLARTEIPGTPHREIEWQRLDLAGLVACVVEDFQVMAQEGSISVTLDASGAPIWVNGDKQRLRQVLFILGDNACRYSNPGGHIAVTLHTGENSATFNIADQGIGIPAEDLGLVFDRHFRSANARRSRHDGAGLGLPMARAILQAHGGQIVAASIEGAGSTFTATLPLASTEQ